MRVVVQGYDINIPKCYRKLKHHTAMPEDKTECEEWEAVRSRPRDKWYAKNQQSQNSDKFPSHVHESGRPVSITRILRLMGYSLDSLNVYLEIK